MTEEIRIQNRVFEPYISAEEISAIVKNVAGRINSDYKGRNPLFLVVLNGAFMFAADLFREIEGTPRVSFVKMSSYENMSSSGKVTELIGLNEDIENQDIIIVEDIVDTGISMQYMLDILRKKNPRSIEIATLMFKPHKFLKDYEVKYVGREIRDEFIIGYGMDIDGLARNLKDIYIIKE